MTPKLRDTIHKRGEKQRKYESEHHYDLEKFGLTEAQVRRDCAFFYETFLPPLEPPNLRPRTGPRRRPLTSRRSQRMTSIRRRRPRDLSFSSCVVSVASVSPAGAATVVAAAPTAAGGAALRRLQWQRRSSRAAPRQRRRPTVQRQRWSAARRLDGSGGSPRHRRTRSGTATFTVTITQSTAVATVEIVTWSVNVSIDSAVIDFGRDQTNFEFQAPVDLTQANYRTLLLGMKQNTTYYVRITAQGGGKTYVSHVSTVTTGYLPNGLPVFTVTDSNASAAVRGRRVHRQLHRAGRLGRASPARPGRRPAFILDKDGELVWALDITSTAATNCSRARMSYDGQYHVRRQLRQLVDQRRRLPHRDGWDGDRSDLEPPRPQPRLRAPPQRERRLLRHEQHDGQHHQVSRVGDGAQRLHRRPAHLKVGIVGRNNRAATSPGRPNPVPLAGLGAALHSV